MGCMGTVAQRRPLKSPEPLQGRLATRPISRLISPVARCPEVGGKEQVAGLWNIIKPLQACAWFSGTVAKFLPLK